MKLIALRCPTCNTPFAPGDDDLVIACDQCGAGIAITDEGLQPIETAICRKRRSHDSGRSRERRTVAAVVGV